MKEHPIIFSGEMIRAILDGKKTQTRRVVKPQPEQHMPDTQNGDGSTGLLFKDGKWFSYDGCPYGKPGDRLWVKETWAVHPTLNRYKPSQLDLPRAAGIAPQPFYKADPETNESHYMWRSSMYMPRWASRITLEIVSVRVERVQEISEQDAKAEGVYSWMLQNPTRKIYKPEYHMLWDKINAKRGFGWDVNPWVWVIEFKRVEAQKGKQDETV